MPPDFILSAPYPPGGAARPPVILMGFPLDSLTSAEAVDHVFRSIDGAVGGWMFTPNLDILRRLTNDAAYAALTSVASLRLADGMPLIWASRLQGTPLPERVAGSEIIWSLCARAARERRTVFLLGGNPGTAVAAAARLKSTNPGLLIVGVECPPRGFESDDSYLRVLEDRLKSAAPNLCLVGLPALKQDQLIRRLLPILPRTWFAGIGVTFSFIAGEVKKPPTIMRQMGLEWLFRLVQEPRRLARRYLIEGIPFAIRLLLHALRNRLCRTQAQPPGLSGPPHSPPQMEAPRDTPSPRAQ